MALAKSSFVSKGLKGFTGSIRWLPVDVLGIVKPKTEKDMYFTRVLCGII